MKKALILGGGGFIGSHLMHFLKNKDYYVIAVDLHKPEYLECIADEFHLLDLREKKNFNEFFSRDIDEVYQLAADMGGAGYVFTGDNDANIMHNSALINMNTLETSVHRKPKKIFILLPLAFILSIIRWIRIILNAQKVRLIRLSQTQSTVGKSYSPRECIGLLLAIMV
jgi:hypothetical protein